MFYFNNFKNFLIKIFLFLFVILFAIILFAYFILSLYLIFASLNTVINNAESVEILLIEIDEELNELRNSINLLKANVNNKEVLVINHDCVVLISCLLCILIPLKYF